LVPKFTPIIFDVGVGLTRCEGIGALMVDVFELNGHNLGCIAFKGGLVEEPPWFGDLETSLFGFGNYL